MSQNNQKHFSMHQSNQRLLNSKRLKKKTSNDSNVTNTKFQKYYLTNHLSLAELQEYLFHDHQLQSSQYKPQQKVFYMIPKKQLIKQNIQDQLTNNFVKSLTNQSSKFKASRANTFTSRKDLTRTTYKNFNTSKQGIVLEILAFKPNRFLNKENQIQNIVGIIAYTLLRYCLCNRIGFKSIQSCYASMMNLRTDSIFHALKQKIYQLPFQESQNNNYKQQNIFGSAPGLGAKNNQQLKEKSKILTLENKIALFAKFLKVCQKQAKTDRNLYDEIDFAVGIDEIILDIFKVLFTDPVLKIITLESIESILTEIGLEKVFIKQVGKDKALIRIDDYQTRVCMNKENQFYFAILEQSQLIQEVKTQMKVAQQLAQLKKSKEPRKASVNTVQEDMESKDVVQTLHCIEQQKVPPILTKKLGKGGFQVLKKETIRSEGQISQESDKFSECAQKILLKKRQSKDFGLNMITNLNLENSPTNSKQTEVQNLKKQLLINCKHQRDRSQGCSSISPISSQQLKKIQLYLQSRQLSNPSLIETVKKDKPKIGKKSSFGLDPLIRQDLDYIEDEQNLNQNLMNLQIRLVQSVRQQHSKLKQGFDKSQQRSFVEDEQSTIQKQAEEFLGFKQIHSLTKSQQRQSQLQDITNDKIQNVNPSLQTKQQQHLQDSKKLKLSFVEQFSEKNLDEKDIGLASSIENRNSSSSVNEHLNKQLQKSIKLLRRQTDITNCKDNQFIRNVPKLDVECLSSDSQESSPKRKAEMQIKALISPRQKQKNKIGNPFTLNSVHKFAIQEQWQAQIQENKNSQLQSPQSTKKKKKKFPFEFNKNLDASKKIKNSKNLTQEIKKSRNSIQTSFTQQTNNSKTGHIPSFLLKKRQQQIQKNPSHQETTEKSVNFIQQTEPKNQYFNKIAEGQHYYQKPITINMSNSNNTYAYQQQHNFIPKVFYPTTEQLRVTSPNLGPQPYKEPFNRNSVGNNPSNRQFFQFRQRHQINDTMHPDEYSHMQNSLNQYPQQYLSRTAHEQQKTYYKNPFNQSGYRRF